MRILVPLDGTSESESSVRVAKRLADGIDSEIYLLHVVEVVDAFSPLRYDPDIVGMMERAGTYLSELASRHELPPDRTRRLVELSDNVAKQIGIVAESTAIDLIIMAAHRKSWLRRLAQGSVYRQVLASDVCPVLGIPLPMRTPADEAAAADGLWGRAARLPEPSGEGASAG
jgi:nucleotide-binding universal stress UspA family protein